MKRLVLLALLAFPTLAHAADIDVVRRNFIGYYTGAGADPLAPRMRMALSELESAARSYTASGFLLSDGSWADINYDETPTGSWSPWDHVRRLTVMAKAYKTPGQALYHDPLLLVQIESALRYINNFYGATTWPEGNWWFWTMGIPLDLEPTLILMRGDISQKTYDDLVVSLTLHIGTSPYSHVVGPLPTGENLVWSSFTHLSLGLLRDDPSMLAAVRDAMASVTQPSTAEGIKFDSSFQQHGAQLYTGGYGGSFASDVAKYQLITRGTVYGLPVASLNAFVDYVADGIAWSLYGNYFDVSVISRQVAYRSTTGINGIAALAQSALFDSPRRAAITSAAARMLESWQWGLPTELAGAATQVERTSAAAAWPSGHRHYYLSDYTVHRRPGYFASIKMFSTRTKSGENTNGENLLGSRQSDGRFFLSLDGTEWFGRDIWPALDWTRLPGITVEQSPTAADNTYGYGRSAYAGGVSDGQNGVSAMQLAPLNSSLTANKAWFFFEDSIVFLANNIRALTGNHVETVVNQWPLSSPTAAIVNGGNWVACDGVGYWFPTATPFSKRETRSGTWAQLGASTDTTPFSATFQTIWFDHGVMPTGATAEYAIVPNATAQSMAAWVASTPISILVNNPTVSAVRDNRTGARGFAFWAAGSVDGVQSDSPAIVYIATAGGKLQVSVADPLASVSGTIHVTIPGTYSGTGTTARNRATTIEVPRNSGKTFTTVLSTPQQTRRRAAR